MTNNNPSAALLIHTTQPAEVRFDAATGQHALHAARDYNPGDTIVNFSALTTLDHATYLTVQVGAEKHITLFPEFLQYVNHSCQPNTFFDTTAMAFIAVEQIRAGEECRFFYPSAEWQMAQPFVCNCGAANCLQLIVGAAHMPLEILLQYRLTHFISDQLTLKP